MSSSAQITSSWKLVPPFDDLSSIEAISSLIEASRLFDSEYYLRAYPDVGAGSETPLAHYIARGGVEGRDPNELFDTKYYRMQCPELKSSKMNPLLHYLTIGAAAGLEINELFDTAYYLERYPDVVASGLTAVAHYLHFGVLEGRDPSPGFRTQYYIERNPDVTAVHMNPLAHYLRFGTSEGRDPSPEFSTSYYLAQNPDVNATKVHPLAHYLRSGIFEGRAAVEINQSMLAAIDSISSYYMMAREIEPLLPPLQRLATLHKSWLPNSSRTGMAYFKLVKGLHTPLSHLIILPGEGWSTREDRALTFARTIKEKSGAGCLLIICADGNDRSVANAVPEGVRVVYLNDLEANLEAGAKAKIITRLALQAGLKVFHNFDSKVGWLILSNYHRQLKARHTKLYAYLPPYHLDQEGIPSGHAIEFLNRCIDHIDVVVVDNNDSRSSLCQLWGLERENEDKLVVPAPQLDEELALADYW